MKMVISPLLLVAIWSCGGAGGGNEDSADNDQSVLSQSNTEETPVIISNGDVLEACLADANTLESNNSQLQNDNSQLQVENAQLRQQITDLQSGTEPVSTTTPDPTEDDSQNINDLSNQILSCEEQATLANQIELGMSHQTVRSIMGRPDVLLSDTLFNYSGANISFGVVSYISPVRTYVVDRIDPNPWACNI